MPKGVAIIGCGLIGQKRAKALSGAKLVACADLNLERAEALARSFPGVAASNHLEEVLSLPEVEVVLVATQHDSLVEIALKAVRAGKHVLVEKPAARSVRELDGLILAAEGADVRVRVGFNHRYHPALQKARALVSAGEIGELMYLRWRYGHGGRLGYEKEWRADPKISGGGELIDQGVHLIDLSRWFLGDFDKTAGFAHTYFWPMKVEDNGFMILRTPLEQTAFLHVSCTEWKNLFSFEIYGKTGKIAIEGLGGSYGVEKLFLYKMLPQMGPPAVTSWEYAAVDSSWELEFAEFLEDIRLKRTPSASLKDARAALVIVEQITKESGYDYHA